MQAMQQQLDFIAYIQRMLVEGDFTATYKFALLHALADICVEQPLLTDQSELKIDLATLADKLIVPDRRDLLMKIANILDVEILVDTGNYINAEKATNQNLKF